jgi:hypothetical protein
LGIALIRSQRRTVAFVALAKGTAPMNEALTYHAHSALGLSLTEYAQISAHLEYFADDKHVWVFLQLGVDPEEWQECQHQFETLLRSELFLPQSPVHEEFCTVFRTTHHHLTTSHAWLTDIEPLRVSQACYLEQVARASEPCPTTERCPAPIESSMPSASPCRNSVVPVVVQRSSSDPIVFEFPIWRSPQLPEFTEELWPSEPSTLPDPDVHGMEEADEPVRNAHISGTYPVRSFQEDSDEAPETMRSIRPQFTLDSFAAFVVTVAGKISPEQRDMVYQQFGITAVIAAQERSAWYATFASNPELEKQFFCLVRKLEQYRAA